MLYSGTSQLNKSEYLGKQENQKYESERKMWRQGIMICRSIINARAWAWEDPNPTTAGSA